MIFVCASRSARRGGRQLPAAAPPAPASPAPLRGAERVSAAAGGGREASRVRARGAFAAPSLPFGRRGPVLGDPGARRKQSRVGASRAALQRGRPLVFPPPGFPPALDEARLVLPRLPGGPRRQGCLRRDPRGCIPLTAGHPRVGSVASFPFPLPRRGKAVCPGPARIQLSPASLEDPSGSLPGLRAAACRPEGLGSGVRRAGKVAGFECLSGASSLVRRRASPRLQLTFSFRPCRPFDPGSELGTHAFASI